MTKLLFAVFAATLAFVASARQVGEPVDRILRGKKSKSKEDVEYGRSALLRTVGGPRSHALGFHGDGDGDNACVSDTECGEFAYRTDFHLEFADGSNDCLEIHSRNLELCRHRCDTNEPGQKWFFLAVPNSEWDQYVVYNPETQQVLEYSSRSTRSLALENVEDLTEDSDVLWEVREDDFFDCCHDSI